MVKKINRGLFSFILLNLGCMVSLPVLAKSGANDDARYVVWGEADYLYAGFKKAPLPIPLVTSSNAADRGVIGRPSTEVLFGNKSYSTKNHQGFSLAAGQWLDDDRKYGIEISGLRFLKKNVTNFSQSNSNSQILAIPFNNVSPGGGSGNVDPASLGAGAVGGPNSFLFSGGNGVGGNIAISSSSQLWGGEVNGLTEIRCDNSWCLNLLYGFRYIDLQEKLNINAVQFAPNGATPLNPMFSDEFNTRNQFYGAQVGVKGEWTNNRFFVNGHAKVALGLNRERLKISGNFADPAPFFVINTNYGAGNTGGIFAQGTNIGVHHHNKVSFVPEIKLQFGYEFADNFRVMIGYFATYINQVIRPGKQIDPNINLTQFGPNANNGPSPVNGTPSPAVNLRQSSFWAQGVSLGVKLRY